MDAAAGVAAAAVAGAVAAVAAGSAEAGNAAIKQIAAVATGHAAETLLDTLELSYCWN